VKLAIVYEGSLFSYIMLKGKFAIIVLILNGSAISELIVSRIYNDHHFNSYATLK